MVGNNDINLSFFLLLNTVMQERFAEQDTHCCWLNKVCGLFAVDIVAGN